MFTPVTSDTHDVMWAVVDAFPIRTLAIDVIKISRVILADVPSWRSMMVNGLGKVLGGVSLLVQLFSS